VERGLLTPGIEIVFVIIRNSFGNTHVILVQTGSNTEQILKLFQTTTEEESEIACIQFLFFPLKWNYLIYTFLKNKVHHDQFSEDVPANKAPTAPK